MPPKTVTKKKSTHKVRSLSEAQRLEAEIRAIREQFEEAEAEETTRTAAQTDAAFEIERDTAAALETRTPSPTDLFPLTEGRARPAPAGPGFCAHPFPFRYTIEVMGKGAAPTSDTASAY